MELPIEKVTSSEVSKRFGFDARGDHPIDREALVANDPGDGKGGLEGVDTL